MRKRKVMEYRADLIVAPVLGAGDMVKATAWRFGNDLRADLCGPPRDTQAAARRDLPRIRRAMEAAIRELGYEPKEVE